MFVEIIILLVRTYILYIHYLAELLIQYITIGRTWFADGDPTFRLLQHPFAPASVCSSIRLLQHPFVPASRLLQDY